MKEGSDSSSFRVYLHLKPQDDAQLPPVAAAQLSIRVSGSLGNELFSATPNVSFYSLWSSRGLKAQAQLRLIETLTTNCASEASTELDSQEAGLTKNAAPSPVYIQVLNSHWSLTPFKNTAAADTAADTATTAAETLEGFTVELVIDVPEGQQQLPIIRAAVVAAAGAAATVIRACRFMLLLLHAVGGAAAAAAAVAAAAQGVGIGLSQESRHVFEATQSHRLLACGPPAAATAAAVAAAPSEAAVAAAAERSASAAAAPEPPLTNRWFRGFKTLELRGCGGCRLNKILNHCSLINPCLCTRSSSNSSSSSSSSSCCCSCFWGCDCCCSTPHVLQQQQQQEQEKALSD
ncbi:hypothetical protein ACSSS7_003619 [Eimeria intestinalis]